MNESHTPAKRWRREGGDRLEGIAMPEHVLQLWEFGYITQAHALNKDFWKSDLCDVLYKKLLSDFMLEVAVVMDVAKFSE